MFCNAVEPRSPAAFCGISKPLVLGACLVQHYQRPEATCIGRPSIRDCLVIGGHELRCARFTAEPRTTTPRVMIGPALRSNRGDAPNRDLDHDVPRSLLVPDQDHSP